MKFISCILFLGVIFSSCSLSISYCGYVKTDKNPAFCDSLIVNSFASDKRAEDVVKNIIEAIGLPKANFVLLPCSKISNCFALIEGQRRYIVYDNDFLEKIEISTKTNWSSISILAHEIGHHLNGHTLLTTTKKNRHNEELDADNFSGFILAKLGASISEAQSAINSIDHPECEDDTFSTHPCKLKRLEAIEKGWQKSYLKTDVNYGRDEILPFNGPTPNVSDKGINKLPKFMVDINRDGLVDFGRFVGNEPNIFLSFQLGKKNASNFNENSYNYNSIPKIDIGIRSRKIWLQDVNEDGILDYCRYVGNFPNIFKAALLGTRTGFDGDQYYRF